MALSNDLISQFAKITRNDKTVKNESTVYGTIVEYNGSKYVKIDGSELLTPIPSTTTNVQNDERVTVNIKNHMATVTGNLSSPSPRSGEIDDIGSDIDNIGSKITEFEIVIAGKVDTEELNAANGRIDELISDNVIIKETLTANSADIKDLEADNVTIKDTLTANSADITDLEAETATITGKLTAVDADIESLQADNVLIRGELTANKADIEDLEADNVTIKETLTANKASIEDLETNKLSANEAELKYANIDFANIGEAAIEKLFSDSGIIGDLVMSDGHITGKLVGVTIIGDLIEAGTLKADKLVILGTDGLYYKLNYDGKNVTGEQTDYNSIHGSIITANTITAEKINVDDLVAFNATIGGFKLTNKSIYSGVKSSVGNTTRGIYLDNDGQIAFGDSNNFVKFFKDTDGSYKLAISAQQIMFGGSGKNIEDAIDEAVSDINIGARNLLRYTDFSKDILDNWTTLTSTGTMTTISLIESDYMKVTNTNGNAAFGAYCTYKQTYLQGGEEYVISFDAYADSEVVAAYCYLMSDSGNVSLGSSVRPTLTTSPTHFTFVFTPTADIYCSFMLGISSGAAYSGSFYFKNLKLEKGNVATDWTPAPEDAEDTIDEIKNSSETNAEAINKAQLVIDQLNTTISSLVTGQNGESLMTQTENGWTFNISNVLDTLGDATDNIDDLESSLNTANSVLNTLNKSVDDLGKYTEYIHLGVTDGKPSITLGETDSAFKLVITNTDIRFMEGSSVPASISNQALNIEKAVINGELEQGGFVWLKRSNGNYGLSWKGV